MAKKREEEDNRDIFEKALDYAPIAGGVAGVVIGSRFGRRAYLREMDERARILAKKRIGPTADAERKRALEWSDQDIAKAGLKRVRNASIGGLGGTALATGGVLAHRKDSKNRK